MSADKLQGAAEGLVHTSVEDAKSSLLHCSLADAKTALGYLELTGEQKTKQGVLRAWIRRAERIVKNSIQGKIEATLDETPFTVSVMWRNPVTDPPDDEITVLICNTAWDNPVWMGWKDGEQWRDVDAFLLDPPPFRWAHLPQGAEQPS